jgi:Dyp-type peroxidase family
MSWSRTEPLDLADIQGFLLSGYPHLPHASYLLLRIVDPVMARRWLGELNVTSAAGRQDGPCHNVAFTHAGLEVLGLGTDALDAFPLPFREGMTSERRSRILADADATHPSQWTWGHGDSVPHVLLMVFAADEGGLEIEHDVAGALEPIWEIRGRSDPSSKEHFGFVDGLSQPAIRGSAAAAKLSRRSARWDVVDPGEFVLGYRDNLGQRSPAIPVNGTAGNVADLTRNGSFLVARQLEQHVNEFHEFLEKWASGPEAVRELAAKMVGRRHNGGPLIDGRGDDLNDFGFAGDPHGLACPVGAHIRRANPRDSLGAKWWSPRSKRTSVRVVNRHRVLRRGRPYGPPIMANPKSWHDRGEGEKQGLFFLCINADIERQFEFVQQSWINDPSFGGLRDEPDPLVADPAAVVPGAADGAVFTEPRDPLRRKVEGLPRFVTVKGGAYFFLPGLAALRYLSSR